MKSLEAFRKAIKNLVAEKGAYPRLPKDLDIEVQNMLTEKFPGDFIRDNYTPAMDKEVEAIWQRKRSKLAKALK